MESELIEFIGSLHPTIKFEFTYSKSIITFLYARIYKNQNEILCTTIYRKPNDCPNFLDYDLAHPKSLKCSIPLSQASHLKRIYCEISEIISHFKDIKDAFIKQDYKLEYSFEIECV